MAGARSERTLDREEARAFYDNFGPRQDRQAFYEDAALDRLLAEGAFDGARGVAEFGCGTGRFAEILLGEKLPADAAYLGVDLSPRMGLPYLDLRPAFVEGAAWARLYKPNDSHWNLAGNRLAADQIYDWLDQGGAGLDLPSAERD